ncbi:Acetyl-coenzyme A synthetase [Enhygromyxa salina]|uniref:acetate--CoA ligase n=1 Tax=Enhygromyxa salina TaxID=215803 RepID=A0A2S9XI87_9BACT|nr:acetate--CoA ligase [Enhygromyxa salina]PRP92598.1 Acetyl-coenzyme A synthetase [Enhygromyxa salina]
MPNMPDYEQARASFSWSDARGWLDGQPGGGLNITHEAVTRHARGPLSDTIALRWLGKHGHQRRFSYAALERECSRFANVLTKLGVTPMEAVFGLCGRIPELYIAALGSLAHRAVFCPLFAAFGPEPIHARMNQGRAKVLVTTRRLYTSKIAQLRERLPRLEHVLITDGDPPPGCLDLRALMAEASETYTIAPTHPEHPALLHFTSGTTGQPRGALHVHEAVVTHHVTGRLALDLRPGDVFWCTADPGWVTGTSYGIIAPLTNGVTVFVDEGELDPTRWYKLLEHEAVTVWYTVPTAIRTLMRAGIELALDRDLSQLRFIASVGEPLNPEAMRWGLEAFAQPIHDNWWQTETGGIMIANYASMTVKPGSMGKPLPGIVAAIVERRDDGSVRVIDKPNVDGELALRAGWPSMFRTYVGREQRYNECFADGWYLTGDLAQRDRDGYYWFVGRIDDMINSAGHLIGPFEVESGLLEHDDVAEVAAIGKPDSVAGEVVKAFVVLQPEVEPSPRLRRALLAFARKRLGMAVAPREIEFRASVPKTRSGKIMRRLLRAQELGLPEGDTSTLESESLQPPMWMSRGP